MSARVFASACLRPAATKPSEQNDKLVKEETIFEPPVISIIKKGTSTSLTWPTARDSVSLGFFFYLMLLPGGIVSQGHLRLNAKSSEDSRPSLKSFFPVRRQLHIEAVVYPDNKKLLCSNKIFQRQEKGTE